MIWISLNFEIVKLASVDWQIEEIIIFAAKEKTSSRKLLIQESDLRGGSKKPLLKEEVQYLEFVHLSSSRSYSAGIGTWVSITWLPRLHRAGPSASLDKSVLVYLIGRFISCVSRVVKCQFLTVQGWFLSYNVGG